MRRGVGIVFSLFFLLAGAGFATAAEQDSKGSKDHPLLTRMPGFHINGYQNRDYESYGFWGQDKKRHPVEGHYYLIQYVLDKGAAEPGVLKIVRNYQEALKRVGGKVFYDSPSLTTVVLEKDGKETWVEVKAYSREYTLYIVEKEAMKQEIVADAAAMGNDINATGHVSVYGIYFDTGKSEVKPESDAAISEIAKLLKNDGALKIYVVGHTDSAGSFDSNMKLSKDRADAVARTLTTKHGIAAARLRSYGVASLAPVTSNDTEDGKAKNRRVELVKQ